MKLPLAKLANPSASESLRLRAWHLAQAFAALPPVFVTLSWLFAAAGIALALVVPGAFWMRGDTLGVVLFGLPALYAIYEIVKLPRRKSVSLPGKFLWSLLLAPPFLGILLYRIGYRSPEAHRSRHSHDGGFPTAPH